jgi:hypothetical protein
MVVSDHPDDKRVWHTPVLVVYVEFKWLSGETLREASIVSRATDSNRCWKHIGLSKLSPDNTLYQKVAERRGILLKSSHRYWWSSHPYIYFRFCEQCPQSRSHADFFITLRERSNSRTIYLVICWSSYIVNQFLHPWKGRCWLFDYVLFSRTSNE